MQTWTQDATDQLSTTQDNSHKMLNSWWWWCVCVGGGGGGEMAACWFSFPPHKIACLYLCVADRRQAKTERYQHTWMYISSVKAIRNWIFLKCKMFAFYYILHIIWAATCNFQQCGILTWIDSGEPVQPPVKLRNSKPRSIRSLTFIEYSSDKQRLWSDCAYAQAGLSLCWSHIPNCWKCHAAVHFVDTCCPEVICFHRYHRKKPM